MKKLTEKKFDAVYNEYGRLVYFIVSKYVGDPFECENLTNDVFMDLYKRKEDVRDVKYYLIASAKNRAVAHLRKKRNVTVPLNEAADAVYVDEGAESDFRDVVEEMRKALSDEEVEIILSHAVFGEKFKSIAKRLKKPLPTVYTLYSRAIKKYRGYLTENHPEEDDNE